MNNKKELLVDEETKISEKNCVGECPYCGSDELYYHDFKTYDESEEHIAKCNDGNKKFAEVDTIRYAYTEYEA